MNGSREFAEKLAKVDLSGMTKGTKIVLTDMFSGKVIHIEYLGGTRYRIHVKQAS